MIGNLNFIILIKPLERISVSLFKDAIFRWRIWGISQKGEKFCILHELRNKTQLGVWVHCEPLTGFRGTRGQAT